MKIVIDVMGLDGGEMMEIATDGMTDGMRGIMEERGRWRKGIQHDTSESVRGNVHQTSEASRDTVPDLRMASTNGTLLGLGREALLTRLSRTSETRVCWQPRRIRSRAAMDPLLSSSTTNPRKPESLAKDGACMASREKRMQVSLNDWIAPSPPTAHTS